MSVAEIGSLHARYVRLTDRFKSAWAYHQLVTGAFRSVLFEPLPYTYDFQRVYDRIKNAGASVTPSQAAKALEALRGCEQELEEASTVLLSADERISPSVLRRFFEHLKRQDESIIHHLLKFYLYSDAVEGDRRDKIDFLFTRIGESFFVERGEYWSGEQLELRERIAALVSILRLAPAPEDEVVPVIRAIRSMRDDIQHADRFEELAERHLLRNARTFKHRVGDLYFHPDVLLSIIELNVATRNRFVRLYQEEEHRILDDADKLMAHGEAIERNFGSASPDLAEEISKFREFKQRFDDARADSNVKYDVISSLKSSIGNILAQLDRGLETGPQERILALPLDADFDEPANLDACVEHFGAGDVLLEYLRRIARAVDSIKATVPADRLVEKGPVRHLRLEPWEAAAYQKLSQRRERDFDEDNEDLWMLYLRAAALRIKAVEEATGLAATFAAGVQAEMPLLEHARETLDWSKGIDETFGAFLKEQVYCTNDAILRQLYRSRFRLLRAFTGLWLIYDKQV